MDESYDTYVGDECFDNHDYDDTDDDINDDNDRKKDSYTAAGAAPGWCCSHPDQSSPCQATPDQARPSQTPKILYVDLVLA